MPLKSTKYDIIATGECFSSYYIGKKDYNEFLFHGYIHYKPLITYFHQFSVEQQNIMKIKLLL